MSQADSSESALEELPQIETEADRRSSAWSDAGHTIAWLFADRYRWELNEALHDVIEPLNNGEAIDADDVRTARRRLDETQQLLEDWLVPMVDDVESWEDGAGSTVPYSAFIEQLENCGYTVARPNEDVVVVGADND